MAMHIAKGRTAARSIREKIDYAINPAKTEKGELVSSYECDQKTAASESALMRKTYLNITGRHRDGEVIAYQLRQSFKPGEIMPEDANNIGWELAARFLKGKHSGRVDSFSLE